MEDNKTSKDFLEKNPTSEHDQANQLSATDDELARDYIEVAEKYKLFKIEPSGEPSKKAQISDNIFKVFPASKEEAEIHDDRQWILVLRDIEVIDLSREVDIKPTKVILSSGIYSLASMENSITKYKSQSDLWGVIKELNLALPLYDWENAKYVKFCPKESVELFKKLNGMFKGKKVKITHSDPNIARRCDQEGVCKGIHMLEMGKSFDIELTNGHRLGFCPDVISEDEVESDMTRFCHTWKRKIQIIA